MTNETGVVVLRECAHPGCPAYRCYYDGLCEWSWGNDDECRLPQDLEADLVNYCTFHSQVMLSQHVREYRAEWEAMRPSSGDKR
ncbi:MAG: hypothetical protein NUW01_03525 [Gemmatimonadaceae bacterium]|nr:hypothetical protein [Gemmatimonadaceae bacterium]